MASAAELAILITAKDSASKVLDGIGKSLGGFGAAGKVAGVALAGVATAGAGLAAVIGSSVGAAANFESAMSGVAAVAGASSDQLAALSSTALQLGQDTSLSGIGATEAAQAMRELAAAGVSVDDIIGGAARGALLLASAGGLDVARAAEIAANALNQFGLSGNQAGHVADLLAGAANASSADVNDLGESLKFVGPIAKSMGLSIEEVVATLAEFGAQGIKGSQAGTSLRSIISSLADPSEKAKNAIKDLNLQFFDGEGRMKSIAGISEELKTKLGGLTDQQRAQALSTLFGNEALSAATILYGEGAAGIAKYLGEVDKAGSAAQTGATRNDNLRGSVEQLKSAWETASIILGQAFLPAIRGLVDGATRAVNAAIPFIQAWGPGIVAALTAAIATITTFGRTVGSAIGAVIEAFRALVSGDISFAQFVGGMEIFVSTVLAKLGQLAQQAAPYLAAFFSAIGGFIAAAAPQVAAQFGQWAGSFVNWITDTALPAALAQLAVWQQGIVAWLTGTALPAIVPALATLGQAFGDWVLTSAVPAVQATLAQWGAAVGTFITSTALPTIQASLLTLGTALGEWVTTIAIPAVQAAMPAWVTTIVQNIQSVLPYVEQFAQALEAGIAGAINAILPLAQQFGQVWQQNLPAVIALGEQLRGVWERLGPLMSALAPIGAALAAVLGGLMVAQVGALMGVLGGLVGMFSGILPGAIMVASGTLTVIQGVLDAVTAVVSGMVATVTALLQGDWRGAWDAATEAARQFSAATATILQGAWTIIQGIFTAGIGAVVGFVSGFVSTITAFFSALVASVTGETTTLSSVVEAAWQGLVATVTGLVTNLIATIVSQFQALPGQVATAMAAVASAILGALGALAGQAGAAAAAIGSAIISGIAGALQAGAGQLASIASSVVQGALDAAKGALGIQSPSKEFAAVGRDIVRGLVKGMDDTQIEAEKKAADLASAVAKAVVDTLAAFKALEGFRGGPAESQVSRFLASLGDFLERFTTAAGEWEEDVLESASRFATASRDAVGIIKGGVEGLELLDSFTAPLEASVSYFLRSLGDFLEKFTTAAGEWEEDVLASASTFAAAAKDAVGVLGGAVSGLMALADFEAPLETTVSTFLRSLGDFMEKFTTAAGEWEADVLESASRFASGTKDAVGVLGAGVAGLMALNDFVAPAEQAVSRFLLSLGDFMEKFSTAAGAWETDVLESASRFGEAAGNVLGIIGNAVEGLSKLNDFVAPSQQAIDNFAYAVRAMVAKFADLASTMTEEGLEQAGALGEAAGQVFAALRDALDVFTDLHDLVVPSAQAIDNFGIAVAYTVRRLGQFAEELGKGGLEQARAFGQSVQSIFSALKSAMDILTNLAKFKDVASKAFDSLLQGMQDAIERAQGMVSASKNLVLESEEYLANMTKAAATFAKGMALGGASPESVGRSLGEGVAQGAREALDIASPSQVFAQIGRDIVAGLVEGMDESQQDAAKKAADVASAIADAVSKGVEAFTKLAGFAAPPAQAVYAFGKTLRMVIKDLEVITEQVTLEAAELAGKFGDGAAKAVAVFSAGIEGFMMLKDFVAPAPAAIFAFGKTLRTTIKDLAVVAEQVGVEAADLAGTFADGAGKAVQIIGEGVEGLMALVDFVAPTESAVAQFLKGMQMVVGRLAEAGTLIGKEPLARALEFGEAAGSIFDALRSGLDLLVEIDQPGNWPLTDWLQPLIEIMKGVLMRGGTLVSQAYELRTLAENFAAGIGTAASLFQLGAGILSGGFTLPAPGSIGGGGTTIINNYYVTGNTVLSKDTATQDAVSSIVTASQTRALGYTV